MRFIKLQPDKRRTATNIESVYLSPGRGDSGSPYWTSMKQRNNQGIEETRYIVVAVQNGIFRHNSKALGTILEGVKFV